MQPIILGLIAFQSRFRHGNQLSHLKLGILSVQYIRRIAAGIILYSTVECSFPAKGTAPSPSRQIRLPSIELGVPVKIKCYDRRPPRGCCERTRMTDSVHLISGSLLFLSSVMQGKSTDLDTVMASECPLLSGTPPSAGPDRWVARFLS